MCCKENPVRSNHPVMILRYTMMQSLLSCGGHYTYNAGKTTAWVSGNTIQTNTNNKKQCIAITRRALQISTSTEASGVAF
jgi:hypothetical protein